MTGTSDSLREIFNILLEKYGPQDWWPGESRLEILVGAILTQNTNWKNVEKAITNLKSAQMLDVDKMISCSHEELAELIRPAGYYNIKAKRLKSFLNWVSKNYEGQLESLEGVDTYSLREELLSIKGIGRETADSILLYGFSRAVFVVDAYTARVMIRHGFIDEYAGYEEIKELFESCLPSDAELFNEFHALIVRLGKEHCKKRPTCHGCPLGHLPHEIEMFD